MNEISSVCRIDRLPSCIDFHATVSVLRLDLLHPVVSGNKWFKLKEYLSEAKRTQKILLTYGGAFSNHIVATAAAANSSELKSIGIICGERPPVLSHTLLAAEGFGMKLYFISREAYKTKIVPAEVLTHHLPDDLCLVPEGGYGPKGVEGAKEILLQHDTSAYTHIVTAVGTGTTLAGLTAAASDSQELIGISVMKNNVSLDGEIRRLLPEEKKEKFRLLHDYHFGGYARYKPALFDFMNAFFTRIGIPTDFVYTGKAFYGVFNLLKKGYFPAGSNILLLHTGGLQGNGSLPKGTLIFG